YSGTVSQNTIFNNDQGISVTDVTAGPVSIEDNSIYSNVSGILVRSLNSSYNSPLLSIANNTIYANSNHALEYDDSAPLGLINNTIYQSQGTVLHFTNSSFFQSAASQLVNNIIASDTGTLLAVDQGDSAHISSDYNLFYRGPNGAARIGTWGTASF